MISTPERIAANRRNSEQSCGPKTAEGKAASSRNALKHGMTANGIAAPADDLIKVGALASCMRDRYKPRTDEGRALLDHAALMLVRLDRMGMHEQTLVSREVRLAGENFDLTRRSLAEVLFEGMEGTLESVMPLFDLPEGVALMIEAYSALAAVETWTEVELDMVAKLTGGSVDEPFYQIVRSGSPVESGTESLLSQVRELIAVQVTDLEAVWLEFDHEAIDRARDEARTLALFPTTPEANLARRYEATTNRVYHQTMKAFHQAEAAAKLVITPDPTEASEPLASFGPAPEPDAPAHVGPNVIEPVAPTQGAQSPQADRVKRPDPRKLKEAQRRKRR